jgi:hypothetical protein
MTPDTVPVSMAERSICVVDFGGVRVVGGTDMVRTPRLPEFKLPPSRASALTATNKYSAVASNPKSVINNRRRRLPGMGTWFRGVPLDPKVVAAVIGDYDHARLPEH